MIRLDRPAVICTLYALAALTGYAAASGGSSAGEPLLPLRLFLPMLTVTVLVLWALVRRHRAAEDSLRASRAALADAKQDLERRVEERTRELRRTEARARRIIDTTIEGFVLTDPESRIVDVNQAVVAALAAPREEILGSLFTDLLAHDSRTRWQEAAADTGRDHLSFEARLRTTEGALTNCLISRSILREDDGTLTGFVAFLADITDLKRAQALREDVERISRHDLKNALNVVMSTPRIMMMESNLTPMQIHCLKMIEESGYLMLNMINLSLDLYKMEIGTYRLNPDLVDLMPILTRIVDGMASEARYRRIAFRIEINGAPAGEHDRFFVHGEKLLCHTMLHNLIKNALEASPPDRAVTIRLIEGEAFAIEVHNMGAVPEVIRGRFFEKYATAGKEGGTGLGTYSARLIAETHGGTIGFRTGQAEGTTVTVRLPRLDLETADEQPMSTAATG